MYITANKIKKKVLKAIYGVVLVQVMECFYSVISSGFIISCIIHFTSINPCGKPGGVGGWALAQYIPLPEIMRDPSGQFKRICN